MNYEIHNDYRYNRDNLGVSEPQCQDNISPYGIAIWMA